MHGFQRPEVLAQALDHDHVLMLAAAASLDRLTYDWAGTVTNG
jgi:hypothetical protein